MKWSIIGLLGLVLMTVFLTSSTAQTPGTSHYDWCMNLTKQLQGYGATQVDSFLINSTGCYLLLNYFDLIPPLPKNVCYESTGSGVTTIANIKFLNKSHSVTPNGNYNYTLTIQNTANKTSTVELEFFMCRCKDSSGNPSPICLGFWPFKNFTSMDYKISCKSSGITNYTISPFQNKKVSMNFTQYKNQQCGAFQMDVQVYHIDNRMYNSLAGYGLLRTCKNCELNFCGDGIKDANEECDDGNTIDDDYCNNTCKKCSDQDKDGICDPYDNCPDSNFTLTVDQVGCDPFQFCKQFICGYSCDYADWKGNELGNTRAAILKSNPYDCKTILVDHEGQVTPKCVPTLCAN